VAVFRVGRLGGGSSLGGGDYLSALGPVAVAAADTGSIAAAEAAAVAPTVAAADTGVLVASDAAAVLATAFLAAADLAALDHVAVIALVAALTAADTGDVAATDAGLDEALPELYFIGSAGFATAIGGPRSVVLVGGDPNA